MPKCNPLPPIEYLRECFDYQSVPGELIWKERPLNHFTSKDYKKIFMQKCFGKRAGCKAKKRNGTYVLINVNGKSYKRSRIIYALHHGIDPGNNLIDHKDRNTLNDKIDNLRIATNADNRKNSNMYNTNTSGIKGVTWHKRRKRWQAQINHNGKYKYLGFFLTIDEAKEAYQRATKELHGEFASPL